MSRPRTTTYSMHTTSVLTLPDLFYSLIEDNGITFQTLVNRSLYLYKYDKDFKSKIDNMTELQKSGSKF
jgi:hypothetical protein